MPQIIQLSLFDGKACTKCKIWKPLTAYNPRAKGKALRTMCVECNRIYKLEHRNKNREHLNAVRRTYYAEHSDRICGKLKAAYDADPEKFRNRARSFRDRFHEKANYWARRSHQRHREDRCRRSREYYQGHKEQAQVNAQRWRDQNREQYRRNLRATKHRRRDQIGNARYRVRDWIAMCNWFGNVCLCCGKDGPLTTDHVIPLARGGTNVIENLQPLCKQCNQRKGAWRPTDYRNPDLLSAFLQSIHHP